MDNNLRELTQEELDKSTGKAIRKICERINRPNIEYVMSIESVGLHVKSMEIVVYLTYTDKNGTKRQAGSARRKNVQYAILDLLSSFDININD